VLCPFTAVGFASDSTALLSRSWGRSPPYTRGSRARTRTRRLRTTLLRRAQQRRPTISRWGSASTCNLCAHPRCIIHNPPPFDHHRPMSFYCYLIFLTASLSTRSPHAYCTTAHQPLTLALTLAFVAYPRLLACPSCTGRTRPHDITNREDTTTTPIVPFTQHRYTPRSPRIELFTHHTYLRFTRHETTGFVRQTPTTTTTYAYALCFTLYIRFTLHILPAHARTCIFFI
jgi:hypothetical protein